MKTIPVIDLFAGPGGLGEGFSKSRMGAFHIAVSIEKDGMAHETLRLRAAHRELRRDPATRQRDWILWDSILESKPWNVVFDYLRDSDSAPIRNACVRAKDEALQLELGPKTRFEVGDKVGRRLSRYGVNGGLPNNAVLIGGPPCQAYSVVGRSRNRGKHEYVAEKDHRHYLYEEYLHVIAKFRPAVFVMENVKGILSSKIDGDHIFRRIIADLERPSGGGNEPLEYVLIPLGVESTDFAARRPSDFILRAERFGVPQARHRVVIVGIRRDVHARVRSIPSLVPGVAPPVRAVLGDLPVLRPQLSYRGRGAAWTSALLHPLFDQAVRELNRRQAEGDLEVAARMVAVRDGLLTRQHDPGAGADRMRLSASRQMKKPQALADWFQDRESSLVANHESRAHMPSDLVRYLFASSFGRVKAESPRLADFPKSLLPDHRNVDRSAPDKAIFKDRFRVQIAGQPSMTVTSHISKDGHAFIHYDAKQCRSLTVREAARLQTFPDTYVFLGNRTSQYIQVGNAVPPKLANQIADLVADVLQQADLA